MYNGSGIFVRLYNWVTDRANGIVVSADRMDAEMDGFATGLSNVICKDGQTSITNDIPWANHKITGLKTGTVRTDAANVGQVQDSTTQWSSTTGGTANAITVSTSPAITAYAAGQVVRFTATNNNTGATTIAWSGLAAKAAQWGGAAMVGGEIVSGRTYEAVYDGTNFQVMGITTATPSFGATITQTSTDAGATLGPVIDQYRNSASPAANDYGGATTYSGQNSTPAKVTYAQIGVQILDPTAASEDASWAVSTIVAGTLAQRMAVGAGVQVGSPTGGDKGAGTVNATNMFINGTPVISPVVGGVRNAKMSVTAASATATFTADEIIVETTLGAGGYKLGSYSQAINLASTGAGGMDTGTAPVSGAVSLYAIYNPTTATASILACAEATSNGSIYAGANMPSGYTASALIGSWRTNGSSQFVVGYLRDRNVWITPVNVASVAGGSAQTSYTSVSLSSAVPLNAISVSGRAGAPSATAAEFMIAADTNGTGANNIATTSFSTGLDSMFGGCSYAVPIITAQTVYYKSVAAANPVRIDVSGYTF